MENINSKIAETYSMEQLSRKADFIRKDLVEVAIKNEAGHIASSLSCVDILVALYYQTMNISADPQWEDRDRLVFSKAHGCYGLYSILSDIGYIKREDWVSFYNDSFLHGCVDRSIEHGIEASCGSLGHGLPQAVGIAFAAKLQKKKFRTYCIVGDGEMQEGSNWEAMQAAAKHQLNNLTVIIDRNGLQAMDFLENILTPAGKSDDLDIKSEAFGFLVKRCDGHSIDEITSALSALIDDQENIDKPQMLLAKTVKGYGLNCMENVPKFHFRIPTETELKEGTCYE